ncbi:zf-HC2 domain-containing protein [Candidatus Bipolaricaulota bacterium]|nr:zf-HC2 domain-containing protein [Candidatus Bipolaricaulota bacterium]
MVPDRGGEFSNLDRWFHPDANTLRDYLAQELSADVCELLEEHLTRCPQCAVRLEVLAQAVDRDARRLERHYQAARSLARDRLGLPSASSSKRGAPPIHGISERLLRSRVAWAAAAVAAMAVLLTLGIAGGWGVGRSSDSPTDDDLLPRGGEIESIGSLGKNPWDAAGLITEIGAYSEYPLERAIAYAIGLLSRMNVPLGMRSLSFETATTYVVQPEDTWESVADALLGDVRLWPILALLNPVEARLGELSSDNGVLVLRVPESEGSP